jgi:hypothetical protein
MYITILLAKKDKSRSGRPFGGVQSGQWLNGGCIVILTLFIL